MMTLGNITLPNPVSVERKTIQVASENLLFNGTTKKKIIKTKYRYVLTFQDLTQSEVNSIMSEYELEEVRTFTSNEDKLPVTARGVHIDIEDREYIQKGTEFRENLAVILTEVN